jgi:hypothetical protein
VYFLPYFSLFPLSTNLSLCSPSSSPHFPNLPHIIAISNEHQVITGGVETNIHNNQLSSPLPEDSVYSPAKKDIEEIMAGSVSKRFLAPVQGVAEKIVRNALSRYPSVRIFAGDKATTMWALNASGLRRITVSFFWCCGRG